MTTRWELPDDLTAARVARAHAAVTFDALGADERTVDDAVLVASELAANAIRHGTPPVVMSIDEHDGLARITVSNHGDSPDPRIIVADPDDPHGRGLAMVETMAAEVGWSRDGDRLDVWAELVVRPAG